MIRELAIYEKALDSVEATEASLLATLTFPSNPNSGYAKTLLVITPPSTQPESEGSVAGMALYFHNYSTWTSAPGIYLEDLFVRPAFRGKGYGTALLSQLAKEVLKIKGRRLDWSVLKWNTPSIKFYEGEQVGANAMSEWMGMRVEGEGLQKLAEKFD